MRQFFTTITKILRSGPWCLCTFNSHYSHRAASVILNIKVLIMEGLFCRAFLFRGRVCRCCHYKEFVIYIKFNRKTITKINLIGRYRVALKFLLFTLIIITAATNSINQTRYFDLESQLSCSKCQGFHRKSEASMDEAWPRA